MPTQSIRLTEDQVQGLVWETIEVTEDYRRARAVYGVHPVTHKPVYAYRTEILEPEGFLEGVQQQRNDNEGRRWSEGSGSDKHGVPLVKVSSIPMNVFVRDFAGRMHDKDYKKWYLNQPENEAFRTRKGKL